MWSRALTYLQNFFSVSPKEARGLSVLVFLSIVFLAFPFFLKRYLLVRPLPEVEAERRMIDSILQRVLSEREEMLAKSGQRSISTTGKGTLHTFNPNSASEEELMGLGIPAFLVKRILKYREKGGQFRRREDLQRIYDFPEDLYLQLESFISLEDKGIHSSPVKKEAAQHLPSKSVAFEQKESPWRSKEGNAELGSQERSVIQVPFDINKADTTQLKRLKGIGSVRARTIVNYRDALGGFHSSAQFKEIFGLDSVSLLQLTAYAKVLSPPTKIILNQVSLQDFLKHPYARKNRKYAEAILRFREQNGPFQSREDLRKLVSVPDSYVDLLAAYLEY
jgi:competence protein ComEA